MTSPVSHRMDPDAVAPRFRITVRRRGTGPVRPAPRLRTSAGPFVMERPLSRDVRPAPYRAVGTTRREARADLERRIEDVRRTAGPCDVHVGHVGSTIEESLVASERGFEGLFTILAVPPGARVVLIPGDAERWE